MTTASRAGGPPEQAASRPVTGGRGRGHRARHPWQATLGEHVLACRATDAEGDRQPLEVPWNLQGMANNVVQRVPVTVR